MLREKEQHVQKPWHYIIVVLRGCPSCRLNVHGALNLCNSANLGKRQQWIRGNESRWTCVSRLGEKFTVPDRWYLRDKRGGVWRPGRGREPYFYFCHGCSCPHLFIFSHWNPLWLQKAFPVPQVEMIPLPSIVPRHWAVFCSARSHLCLVQSSVWNSPSPPRPVLLRLSLTVCITLTF